MFTKFGLPIVALVLLVFAVKHVADGQKPTPKVGPSITPPQSPYDDNVAGAGMVEAQTENISIGSPVSGIVISVSCKVNQRVEPGDELFRLDDRQLQSELKFRQAAAAASRAELNRLENQPRAEQLQMSEAQVREAEANLENQRDLYNRTRDLASRKVATAEDLVMREQSYRAVRAQVDRYRADLEMVKAGAWEYDKQVAAAACADPGTGQADRNRNRTLGGPGPGAGRSLTGQRSPRRIRRRPGQPGAVVLGNVEQLHVRVDISEYDIHRFNPDAPAEAMPKGQPGIRYPLKLVKIEPYVVPKRSLTGDKSERVDTRVLQVIYELEPSDRRLYVGQQLDVYIKADKPAAGSASGR